jgi:hypothetical protein
MTIEERKIALINWITNLEDEQKISQIEAFRQASIEGLPGKIVELLKISDAENIEDCIEHSYPWPEPVEGNGFDENRNDNT